LTSAEVNEFEMMISSSCPWYHKIYFIHIRRKILERYGGFFFQNPRGPLTTYLGAM